MNDDICFARVIKFKKCKILGGVNSSVQCDGLNKECPFYKSRKQNDEELLRYNGTTSVKDIVSDYREEYRLRHGGE